MTSAHAIFKATPQNSTPRKVMQRSDVDDLVELLRLSQCHLRGVSAGIVTEHLGHFQEDIRGIFVNLLKILSQRCARAPVPEPDSNPY
jgi:hypothetical protein